MRNSKQQAQYLLAKLNRAIELALEIPKTETWAEALANGNSYLHNIKSCLDRQTLSYESPSQILDRMYKYCLSEVRSLNPDEDYIPFNEFKEVIDKLPESLNQMIHLTPKEIEKFGFSLWEAFEECEIGFDLGDDGTDEMEQTIELLGIIISEYKQTADHDENDFNLLLKILLHEKYSLPINGFMPSIYLSFVDCYNLLNYIKDNGVMYNDEVTMFFGHVQTEYLEPNQKDTTHPAILCLSNPLITNPMSTRKLNAKQALHLQKIKNAIEAYIFCLIEEWVLEPDYNSGNERTLIPFSNSKQVYDDNGNNPKEMPDCCFTLQEPQSWITPDEAILAIRKKVSEQIDKHSPICIYVCKDNREVTIEDFDEIKELDHITDKWQDAYESTDIEYPCLMLDSDSFAQGLGVNYLYIGWD